VEVLSGGERGRLALAKLSLQDTNLLLLDEPTNHLDIPSQEILQEVLDEYGGTILLVTHDRYLIDALATQIWEIASQTSEVSARRPRKEKGTETSEVLQVFKGTYSQMKAERERLEALRAAEAESSARGAESRLKSRRVPDSTKEARRRVARLQELENEIAALESELGEIGHKLENPPADTALVRKWGNAYATLQKEMDGLLSEWEGLQV